MRRFAMALMLFALLLAPSALVAAQEEASLAGTGDVLPPLEANETLLMALAGDGAEAVRGEDGTLRMVLGAHFGGEGTRAERAIALVRRFALLFGLPADVQLAIEDELSVHGLYVVRLVREVGGVRVLGTTASVRFGADELIDLINVSPSPAAIAGGRRVIVHAADAAAAARVLVSPHQQELQVLSATPLLLPLDARLVPVWAVDVRDGLDTSLSTVFIDARDGSALLRLPRLAHAMGTIFARNRVSDMDMTADAELTDLTGTGLTGRYARVTSCNAQPARAGCSPRANAVADAEGNFLYAPVASDFEDAFAEVNAYHHVNAVARYFRETHGFTWRCGASTTLDVLVNYSEAPSAPYDNAAYSPGGGSSCGYLLFGEGTNGDFAWDADVVYHEYGHAVTDALTSILGFSNGALGVGYEPLAINEGISDYWAGTLQGDGAIAESFSGEGVGGGHASLRVIENDLTCPSDLVGEGHFDGRIFSAMVWDVRTAAGATTADTILFAAIPTFMADISLASAATLFRAAAMSLVDAGTVEASVLPQIDAAIARHGLTDCRRVVPLDDGRLRQSYSGTESVTGSLGRSVAPIHYSIEVPADATSLTLRVSRQTFAGSYSLHLRAGTPVRVATRVISSFETSLGAGGDLVLTDSTEFPLPRCQTLYIAVQVDDLNTAGQSLFGIQSFLETSGDPAARCAELDAGVAAADAGPTGDVTGAETSAGCGCRAGGSPSRGPMLGLGLAAVAMALRRRGRR